MFSTFDMLAIDNIRRDENFNMLLDYICELYTGTYPKKPINMDGESLLMDFQIELPLSKMEARRLQSVLERTPGIYVTFDSDPTI